MGALVREWTQKHSDNHPSCFLGTLFSVFITHLQAESPLSSKLTCNSYEKFLFPALFYALLLPNRDAMELIQKRLATIKVK